jgi:hypothetical protein
VLTTVASNWRSAALAVSRAAPTRPARPPKSKSRKVRPTLGLNWVRSLKSRLVAAPVLLAGVPVMVCVRVKPGLRLSVGK